MTLYTQKRYIGLTGNYIWSRSRACLQKFHYVFKIIVFLSSFPSQKVFLMSILCLFLVTKKLLVTENSPVIRLTVERSPIFLTYEWVVPSTANFISFRINKTNKTNNPKRHTQSGMANYSFWQFVFYEGNFGKVEPLFYFTNYFKSVRDKLYFMNSKAKKHEILGALSGNTTMFAWFNSLLQIPCL